MTDAEKMDPEVEEGLRQALREAATHVANAYPITAEWDVLGPGTAYHRLASENARLRAALEWLVDDLGFEEFDGVDIHALATDYADANGR